MLTAVQPPHDAIRATAIAKWYLRSLNLGTNREELSIVNGTFTFPPGTTEERFYGALLLVQRYGLYASKVKKERPIIHQSENGGNSAPAVRPAALDLVPLAVIFNVALGLSLDWNLMLTPGSEPPESINWERFGFPNPLQEPHRCVCHSRLYVDDIPPDVIPAYPQNILPCAPEVCTHAMQEIYSVFRDVIDTKHWASMDREALDKFRTNLLHRNRLARICTVYLRGLSFGNRTRMIDRPWECVQVLIAGGGYPAQVYFAALYMLRTYQDSEDFDRNTLADVPLDWVFYVAVLIAADILCDKPFTASSVLSNLGFPHAIEGQTKRWVCPAHSLLKEQRDQEERSAISQKWLDVMTIQERCSVRKERHMANEATEKAMSESQGREIEVGPGPINSGMGPLAYMRCDGGFPCIEGMLRLKDYMLAEVFKWNLPLQTDAARFTQFELYMKGQLR